MIRMFHDDMHYRFSFHPHAPTLTSLYLLVLHYSLFLSITPLSLGRYAWLNCWYVPIFLPIVLMLSWFRTFSSNAYPVSSFVLSHFQTYKHVSIVLYKFSPVSLTITSRCEHVVLSVRLYTYNKYHTTTSYTTFVYDLFLCLSEWGC